MPEPIRELAPGILHWKARHPNLGADVSSYALTESRVLIDPIMPSEGLDWFEDKDLRPVAILLTNRHHWRSSGDFVARFGCTVHASRPGMHEFGPDRPVEPFDFGAVLHDGIVAHEVGVICPDETALEIPAAKALAVADGVIDYGRLGFVPDNLLDEPEHTKRGLYDRYERLADTVDFEHLLVAHGDPIVLNGRAELREWAARREL
ncbi:MAG TPA: hypothetical protein VGW75_01805 [Solirubrobacteraceae bacterium]|jgi:hypothetical protein|nr:hypothetical protein [Solirubrobacteraceae bacterium]